MSEQTGKESTNELRPSDGQASGATEAAEVPSHDSQTAAAQTPPGVPSEAESMESKAGDGKESVAPAVALKRVTFTLMSDGDWKADYEMLQRPMIPVTVIELNRLKRRLQVSWRHHLSNWRKHKWNGQTREAENLAAQGQQATPA